MSGEEKAWTSFSGFAAAVLIVAMVVGATCNGAIETTRRACIAAGGQLIGKSVDDYEFVDCVR